jgi:hypothetical protein
MALSAGLLRALRREHPPYNLGDLRYASKMRTATRFLDLLRDLPIFLGLWLLDRVAGPYPETEEDRVRERRRQRLRRSFPDIDFDGTGPTRG